MSMSWRNVAWWAIGGAVLGLMVWQMDAGGELAMNPLGVVSFTALGACLGCLRIDDGNPFDSWF